MSYIISYNIGDNRAWMVLEQPAPVEGSLPTAEGWNWISFKDPPSMAPVRSPGDLERLLFQHIKSLEVPDAKDIYRLRRNTDERFFQRNEIKMRFVPKQVLYIMVKLTS